MPHRIAWLVVLLALAQPTVSVAQEHPLSEILVRLIQSEVQLAGPPPGSVFPSHAAHFIPGEDAQLAPYLFNQAIVSQLATFPIGTSSGGFSYQFDASLGTYVRSTTTFGPLFAERAVTVGRHRWSTGFNYQHAGFKSFEGKDMDAGDIKFYLTHQPLTAAFFEGDIVGTSLKMDLSTDTFAMFANYGVTDRFDVGVVLPILRVSMDASVDATIIRLATLDTGPTSGIHTFPGALSTSTFTDGGTASGIGDILLRAKYVLLSRPGGGLAAGFDLRTPTGDEANLLGTGATQARLLMIGSTNLAQFSPHVNVGYTFSGEGSDSLFNVTDEFNYSFGTEFTPDPKVTFAFDLVGRQLRDSGRLVEQPRTFNWTTLAGVSGSTTFNEFALQPGSVNSVFASVGGKFNAARNLLISANLLLPLTDAGMRSSPVPVVGIDYTF